MRTFEVFSDLLTATICIENGRTILLNVVSGFLQTSMRQHALPVIKVYSFSNISKTPFQIRSGMHSRKNDSSQLQTQHISSSPGVKKGPSAGTNRFACRACATPISALPTDFHRSYPFYSSLGTQTTLKIQISL